MNLRLYLVLILAVILAGMTPAALAQSPCGSSYTVVFGDTLSTIARRCDTTVSALLQANPQITDPSIISVGTQLVMPGQGDNVGSSQAVVAIYPLSGDPGTVVDIIANGLPASTDVSVGIGRQDSEPTTTQAMRTTAHGALRAQMSIPDSADIGDPWVVVIQTPDDRINLFSQIFAVGGTVVTPGPTQAPPDAVFERTSIYLIALEDAGQSGEQIGCNDSVIPVEVAIEPTVAPLTAAVEQLLAIDQEFYGQSGLYNALYQSDLTLQGIDIENREAIINLSGSVISGGTCDDPRIRAQLEQTALQYGTVDSVTININGQPL